MNYCSCMSTSWAERIEGKWICGVCKQPVDDELAKQMEGDFNTED